MDTIRAAVEAAIAQDTTTEPLQWSRARWVEEDHDTALHLSHSLVHESKCGRVILESGAPMTDGSTAYMVWVRVPDSDVDLNAPYSPFYDGPCRGAGCQPVGRVNGRFYAHVGDEGGLRSAKHAAAVHAVADYVAQS